MDQLFYTGVIENRDDPLKLGRYQVRVFGVHSPDLNDVPTSDLPWALTLAAYPQNSGVGLSPQFLEGSYVFVFFQDGESRQMPIIMGAFAGVPFDKNFYTDSDSSSSANQSAPSSDTVSTQPPPVTQLTNTAVEEKIIEDFYSKLKKALGKRESNDNYTAINQIGYVGKYQFGAPALIDTGLLKNNVTHSMLKRAALEYKNSKDLNLGSDLFTGKSGVTSIHTWLNSPAAQESAMDALIKMNEKRLIGNSVINSSTTAQEKAGYLAAAHLIGAGGVRAMVNGTMKSDANGVTGKEYYDLGYKALSGKEPKVNPEANTPDNPAREPSVIPNVGTTASTPSNNTESKTGFSDPNNKFPRWTKEQDTSRLMRHQNVAKTSVGYKDSSRLKNVLIAGDQGTWDQPNVPYNTKYPYNLALETESGHVLEFDDTPANERINLFHTKGTFMEIDCNGTRVTRIVGDDYTILERNGNVHVAGNVNITVDGNANLLVKNNMNIDVNGNISGRVGGNVKWVVEGRWDIYSHAGISYNTMGNFDTGVYGNMSYTVNGNTNSNTKGTATLNSVGKFSLKTLADMNIGAAGNLFCTSGANTAIDSAQLHLNSGVSSAAVGASVSMNSTSDPGFPAGSGDPKFDTLVVPVRNFETMSEFDDSEDGATDTKEYKDHQKKMDDEGMIDPNPPTPEIDEKETQKKQAEPSANEIKTECSNFKTGAIDLNTYISPNFRLSQLTGGRKITAQVGLTDVELACNLKHLALNVLEPIKAKYPDMRINSGLRPMGANKNSQHPKGCAADLSFSTKKSEDYINIARWITENIITDQVILEYRTSAPKQNGQLVTWIHVSYNKTNNRKMYFTMNNDIRVGNMSELKLIRA